MRPMRRRHRPQGLLALGASVLVCSFAGHVAAGECTDEPRVCGRRAFDEGVKAFKEKDFDVAYERFTAAYAIQQHPIVVYNLALAEIETDRLLAALGHLDQLLSDPTAGEDLVANGREETERALGLVGKINVDVAGVEKIEVAIDGKPALPTDGIYRVDPGEYAVKVVGDGAVLIERRVKVARGERVTLSVGAAREAAPAPTAPVAEPPAAATPTADAGGVSPVWFYVSGGVTLALAGVTVWSGMDTNSAKSEFDARTPTLPRAAQQKLLDDGHAKETRTNVLLVATGVGALATGALGVFAVRWGNTGETTALSVSPGRVAVGGRF